MEKFYFGAVEESIPLFERAAAKGHEESIWIVSVMKDVEMETSALIEAFAKTEEPLGWYFAGRLSGGREAFDFYKKSAEGGCSWGQVWYGKFFEYGFEFVERDKNVYVEWREKAANQNNPWAMDWLGEWFRDEGGDMKKARSYFRAASELGWEHSMSYFAMMLREGEGCEKDIRQAAIWGAKGKSTRFWQVFTTARVSLEEEIPENLDFESDQLCYTLGWGLYWYMYGSAHWDRESGKAKAFGNRCLDYYCSCVELQQKSIFSFLLCWNRTTGVKGPGQMIAQMVWEEREDNLVVPFDQNNGGEEPQMKRIKK
jgi:TPR repeat protein